MGERSGAEGIPGGGFHVERFVLGAWSTNCYVVRPETATACWIVDAGFEPGELIGFVQSRGLVPDAVILTHAHVDHIGGLTEVRRAFPGVPVWGHAAEREWPGDPMKNLSAYADAPVSVAGADRFLNDGEALTLGSDRAAAGCALLVRHTPGHSPGGISLLGPGVAIVGDTLLAGSIGRTDFPGSDHGRLVRSIREGLYTLPTETRVLPGHGPETTVGRERAENPFVRGG